MARIYKRGAIGVSALMVFYVSTFALNSCWGGYWLKPERDGHDRWSIGLSMHTAFLWQPFVGYWSPYRSDWIGMFFFPAVRLDRRFIHPTHYATDPDFESWVLALNAAAVHPDWRNQYHPHEP